MAETGHAFATYVIASSPRAHEPRGHIHAFVGECVEVLIFARALCALTVSRLC